MQYLRSRRSVWRGQSMGLVLCGLLASFLPSAGAVDAGVTDSEVKISASLVLSGPLGDQAREYVTGSRLYFDSVNKAGGVHGRKIVYATVDDGFDVGRAVANTKKLIEEDKVFAIYHSTGTAHTAAILPIVTSSKTIVFGPVTGASSLRTNFVRELFHVRASYANEAAKIASQLKEIGVTRIAAVYQDDVFGKTLLGEVQAALAAQSIKLVTEIKLDPTKYDFVGAAAQAKSAQPQAMIMCTGGSTFPLFVKAVNNTDSRPIFYGFSVASLGVIRKELGVKAAGIVLAQIMPSLKNTSTPVVADYLRLSAVRGKDVVPSAFEFEGFLHARLFVEGLQRAGRKLTTDSFTRALEGAGELRYGKFAAVYTPQSHKGSSYVELAIIDTNGQLRY
ncbi:MAG: ABC transporter substrate-binding protein [Burkholderiaceae bacterium]|nr:ABC transporter substrate-binding protein [Burkholderiaceae bacterium]